ncbi:hypothetical protein [Pararhodobacter zhoushanensis]|uniref:Uncharacterized protein n=1 Tax=Pararhodobacter zhoushanensis TaxID=2479545 RepID=A0ABT3H1M4_9RHOB|nr:hypothetical protein [Pararhodobacter zhoushanensis]MCW1933661.1 hypothetical protein [Pararhodobacter zhoushanensis]
MTTPDNDPQAPGPASSGPASSGPADASRLRDAIDRGGTGDKVAFSDPAAAPLGTDDEAAGTPPTPQQVRTARLHEAGRAQPKAHKPTPAEINGGVRWWTAAVVILVALAVLVAAWALIG